MIFDLPKIFKTFEFTKILKSSLGLSEFLKIRKRNTMYAKCALMGSEPNSIHYKALPPWS